MKYKLKSYSLPIDNTIRIKIVAITTIEIDFTNTNLVVTATIAITVQIPETYALFVRNYTVDLRSIYRRNKRPKRLDSGLRTSINLILRPGTLIILIYTSQMYTYSMWPKLKAKMEIIQIVKMNLVTLLRLL